MNKTRRDWSSFYRCCKDKRDSLTAFYSTASAVFSIFISFYCAVYYFGSKYPQTEILDAREISRVNEDVDGVASLHRPGPSSNSSSSSQPRNKQKSSDKKLIINEEDSEDDEPLISNNKPVALITNLISLDNWNIIYLILFYIIYNQILKSFPWC